MSKMETPPELDEQPLDPEVEKVRRKMVRLLAVSIGIMFIGVMAVLVAIVYRISETDEAEVAMPSSGDTIFPAEGAVATAEATLPAGFTVSTVSLDGSRILFFGMSGEGASMAYVFDIVEDRIVAEISIGQ